MQVLLSVPGVEEIEAQGAGKLALFRKICGIPLLLRVLATASRSGATEVLLLHSKDSPEARLKAYLNSPLLSSLRVHILALDKAFDPDNPSDWQAIESRLESKFLWLPWNYVVNKKLLSRLIATGKVSDRGVRFAWPEAPSQPRQEEGKLSPGAGTEVPAVCIKEKLNFASGSLGGGAGPDSVWRRYLANPSLEIVSISQSPGILVRSGKTARQAERELVRRSGKDSDGIYTKFNRWLCRPAVRWLSKTPVTPNVVTFTGLALTVLAAYAFAQGHWSGYVLGALLYFVSVLMDEIDGMLARITFRESAFGCWLESSVDYTSYFVLFAGMTVGLYRESGALWLAAGGVLLVGSLILFFVVSKQRKLATDPQRPEEYRGRLHQQLEADSGNSLSWFARRVEFLIRKPAFCHYLILFSLLGGIKVLFLIMVFGTNLSWMLVLHFNRFFRLSPAPGSNPLKEARGI